MKLKAETLINNELAGPLSIIFSLDLPVETCMKLCEFERKASTKSVELNKARGVIIKKHSAKGNSVVTPSDKGYNECLAELQELMEKEINIPGQLIQLELPADVKLKPRDFKVLAGTVINFKIPVDKTSTNSKTNTRK